MNELLAGLMSVAALGKQVPLRDELDLSAMAQAIAMRLSATAAQRKVRWIIAPGLKAWGDRALVTVVLENLLDNAWKHTSQAPQALIEFGQDDAPARGVATYFVRDNGTGFDMADAAVLFEPFQRRLSARKRAGNGLGLAAVKRIVGLHGGEVWADSQPAAGTTFRFTLERASRGLPH
jgi:signal transduction histidine kinase